MLPEVTEDRWQYKGTAEKRGYNADVWELTLEPNEGYGTYHSNYTLYVKRASLVIRPFFADPPSAPCDSDSYKDKIC